MQSINTDAAQGYHIPRNLLAAVIAFAFNSTTKVLTLTDGTTYPDGDARKSLSVEVFDKFGGKKQKSIGGVGEDTENPVNSLTVDLDHATDGDGAALNLTEGVSIIVTVVSEKGCIKDGSVHDIATLKSSGNVTMQK